MLNIRVHRFFGLFISFFLLVAPLPLSAIAQEIAVNISQLESDVIAENPDESYVYLGKERSNIADIVAELCSLDEDINSPLYKLHEHINNGYSIAERDAVMEAFGHAQLVLSKKYNYLEPQHAEKIVADLNEVIDAISADDIQDLTRAYHVNSLIVDKNLVVKGESQFDKHIRAKQGITADGHLKVGKSATFKKNVKVRGTLSATNADIENLTVSGALSFTDISVVDATVSGTLSVNDLVVNNCMNDLCVNALSVVDQSVSGTLSINDAVIENLTLTGALSFTDISVVDATVSGTLSVNDAIVDNLTVNGALSFANISVVDATISGVLTVNDIVANSITTTELSSTDAIIQNLSVQNLSVTDCIANLCVTSLSVLDESISGTLSVNEQVINSSLEFDAAGSGYVGLQAPATIPSSYILSLPSTVPTTAQTLRAGTVTPTDLVWISAGGSISPAVSRIIYVATYGNDVTGNGSFDLPYASLAKAIDTANSLSSASDPITIFIGTGVYTENNSAGPLIITADGISIVGAASNAVVIMPNTPSNDLLLINQTITISNITLESSDPLATGLVLTAGVLSTFTDVRIFNFLIGANCSGSATYEFDNCLFIDNITGINVNNTIFTSNNSSYIGTLAGNTGITITGSSAFAVITSGLIVSCTNGIILTNNASATISAVNFKINEFDIIQNGSSQLTLSGCTFELTTSAADIDIQISGAGTTAEIIGCELSGTSIGGVTESTGIVITDNAKVNISGGTLHNYTTGLQVGTSSDSSSTQCFASSFVINDCTTDIIQEGSSTLSFSASTATSSKITINDSTNVNLAFFDLDTDTALTIGSLADQNTTLIQAAITPANNPEINYYSSLYATKAIGFDNSLQINSSSWFVLSNAASNLSAITTDRTKVANLQLLSDAGSPVGGTSALRGWDINKNASAAQLSFNYQNSDIVGQSAIPEYTVMQLDGVNNLLQLPTVGTEIVFAGDTNLYRSSAGVLQTDDNFVVGTLTPNRAVITNGLNQLASSAVTSTELGYLSGVTSSIQMQLNGKVSKSGDTITGTLSVTDVVASSITTTELSATDGVITNVIATNMSVLDQTVTGTLSVNDEIVQAITANNLSATDAIIQNSTISILSATDAIIQNQTITNFSATDAIIQSGTITTFSSTDAIIQNLSVQNLSVTDCIANLCVTNLSVVNESISGTLSVNDEVIKNFLNFNDSSGIKFVGITAPTSITSNYTVALPSTTPLANQVLRASATTPTNLAWITEGGSVTPAASKMIYVAKYGNDSTGDGSFNAPYLTLSKAITAANGLASIANPITIIMMGGIYVENNSAGPLTITASNISLVGDSATGVVISPSTVANNLLLITNTTRISNITFQASSQLATCISLSAGNLSTLTNLRIVNFLVGVSCAGGSTNSYGFNECLFVSNGTALVNNNSFVECNNCTIFGAASLSGPAANTGVNTSGSSGRLIMTGGVCGECNTAFMMSNNAITTISSVSFRGNTADIIQNGPSSMVVSGSTFELTNNPSDIDIQVSGAGAIAQIIGCEFNGRNLAGTAEGTGILISNDAYVSISGGSVHDYNTGIQVGISTDASSTILFATAIGMNNNSTNDILQQGSASLNFNAGTASSSKISINDPTNITLAFFDLDNNNALNIGSQADQDTTLLQAEIGAANLIGITYQSSLYATQAIGLENLNTNPTSWFVLSNASAQLTGITTDRMQTAGIRLVSDAGLPVGGTSALRGWDINKNGFTSELSFNYQNSDIFGQLTIPEYTVMQLDGVNNLLQLPTAGTEIVFAGDTNLYRSSAGVLQTDNNLIVNTLTPGFVVVTDPVTNQLISSVVTDTELSFLSGALSSIQTQLNNKVSKMGDTMTGTLELPAGSTSSPSLIFTGSETSGLSANANTLSFSTNGNEAMSINSSGIVAIDGFTTAGVVHNDASGNLSSSLIVDSDITVGTIANNKLATATSTNTPNSIVVRDSSGNFAANMITLDGAVVNATDAATKAYVDSAVSSGIVPHDPALVVATTDIGSPPSGLQTIDGVTLNTNDRVLLVGQINQVENGLWLAQAGAWTRPTDFASGTEAGPAYVLILEGTIYAGSSWLCSTPTAIIDTDPIRFSLFSLPDLTTGANIGAGTGLVFATKTGITLNFRSLITAPHMTITTNTSDITFGLDATNLNTPSTIVSRDASGNFNASTIVASLTGAASLNVLKAGDTMTGPLQLPAGTTSAPSLKFTGSTTTGLSANSNVLSFSTAGAEAMNINASGIITIDGFTTAGVVHNNASGNLSSSLIVDADIASNANISNSKLATLTTPGLVANSATTATSANTPNTIVLRDASGNFNAGTIIASLLGAASANVLKAGDTMTGTLQLPAGTTALPSLVFTGSTTSGLSATSGNLSFSTSGVERMKMASGGTISIDAFTSAGIVHNDPSGNLSSSLILNADVSASAGITDNKLATISTAGKVANSATTATSANTANAIVARDSSGNFSAGTITASLNGNATSATTATTATTATNFTGSLSGDVTGTQSATVVSFVGGQTAANVASATVAANAATSTNTANTIVKRDGLGNFSAGTITANLSGNATTATTATNATNFTGSLSGDVTGTQSATVVSFVGGQTAANVAAATVLANAATNLDTANAIVKRDGAGSFAAGLISVTDEVISNSVMITPFTTAGVVHNNSSGLLSSSLIVNADVDPAAAIVDTKLATISTAGKVANSATTATSANTANTIVLRDASGNFNAGTIIASLTGAASFNVLKAGDTMTGTLQLPAGTTALPSLVFTGSTTSGLSASSGNLSFSTNGVEQMKISSGGTISIDGFVTPGIVHNDGSGNLSSSLILNADVSASAGITDNKLATISTAGKVANSATTATSANTANAIVLRDSSGNFSAGTITASLNGNATSATTAGSFSGSLSGDVTGTQSATVVSFVGGQTAANVASATVAANAATSANTASTIVKRDASSNFSAGTITANLSGNATTATTATNFSGSLSGDVTGTQNATVVSLVGGQTAANVAAATVLANAATNLNTASTIVKRDTSGSFAAGLISVTDEVISNTFTITPFTTAGILHNNTSGAISSSLVVNADVSASAAITDSKLATISTAGKVANSATTATSLNTANAIVARDALGNFSAGTITANLSGNATTATTATNFSGSLSGDVTGTQSATVVSLVGGQTAANVASATVAANAATSANTANTIVKRDASGNFITNMITIVGTTTNPTDVATKAYVDAQVGGTNLNTPNTLVKRDGTGSFAAQVISMTDGVHSGNLILSTEPSTSTAGNILKGSSSFIHDFGTNNAFVGINAGNFTMSGTGNNVGFGTNALTANTTGSNNVAVGTNALTTNSTGFQNVALGAGAMQSNVNGSSNVAVGYNALNVNTASSNVAVGAQALPANTSGTNNAALGFAALQTNVTGSSNTALGSQALLNNTVSSNTAIGAFAMTANTTGNFNTAVGSGSLNLNTTGTNNTAVGSQSLAANTASNNTAIGYFSLSANTTGIQNSAFGASALTANTIGTNNTAIGYNTLAANTTGANNTAIGFNALAANATGTSNNTAVGSSSLAANTTGTGNTAVGKGSLATNTIGIENTAIGYNALTANTTGTTNIAVGYSALAALSTGVSNVAVGAFALNAATTPNYNIGIGSNALLLNTTGTRNVGIGDAVLSANVTGSNNIAMGKNALLACTGSSNTAIGDAAGSAITTGGTNIAIGASSGGTLTTGSNNIYVGANAGSASEAETIRIGSAQTSCFIQGIFNNSGLVGSTVVISSSGQLGIALISSQRFKHNIQDMNEKSANVFQLRPVTFAYNTDETESTQFGLIAEEVDKIFPELVVRDNNNEPYTVQYAILPVLLLNEMKKQQEIITQQQHTIENLSMNDVSINDALAALNIKLQEFMMRVTELENKVI